MELGDLFAAADRWLVEFGRSLGVPPIFVELLATVLAASVIVGLIAVLVLAFVYAERKISAHIQNRMGPMRVGWHGILQTLADGLKMLQKEDIMPAAADRWIADAQPSSGGFFEQRFERPPRGRQGERRRGEVAVDRNGRGEQRRVDHGSVRRAAPSGDGERSEPGGSFMRDLRLRSCG